MMAMQRGKHRCCMINMVFPQWEAVSSLSFRCLFFLALYRVFYNIPAYLDGVKGSFTNLVTQIQSTSGYTDTLGELMSKFNFTTSSGLTSSNVVDKLSNASGDTLSNYIIDILYKLPSKGWDALFVWKIF